MQESGSRPSRFTPVMRASPLSCDCPAGVAEPGADALPAGERYCWTCFSGRCLQW
ncbi:hypothetical protein ACVXHB_28895 [Escherichia coli]